jgi:hypothetical protein
MKVSHYKNVLPSEITCFLYKQLESLPWQDGIPSRVHGFTRKALMVGKNEFLFEIIMEYITPFLLEHKVILPDKILGFYLNYYRNKDEFTPTHNHKGTNQMVLSLGGTRTLMINKKAYSLNDGDVIYFGSQNHGVPKEIEETLPRISIATFSLE